MHGNGNDRDREFAGYLMFIFEPLSETILRYSKNFLPSSSMQTQK